MKQDSNRNVYLEDATDGLSKVKKPLLVQKAMTSTELENKALPNGVVEFADRPGKDKSDDVVFFKGKKLDLNSTNAPKELAFKFAPNSVARESPSKRISRDQTPDKHKTESAFYQGKNSKKDEIRSPEIGYQSETYNQSQSPSPQIEAVTRRSKLKQHPAPVHSVETTDQQKGAVLQTAAAVTFFLADNKPSDEKSNTTRNDQEQATSTGGSNSKKALNDLISGKFGKGITAMLGIASTMVVATDSAKNNEKEDKDSDSEQSSKKDSEEEDEEVNMTQKYEFLELSRIKRPKEMLEAMSFVVPLDKLYTVQKTCMNNVRNLYVPVELKIIDKRLMSQYAGAYLLQVWDRKSELAFEFSTKWPVEYWSIVQNNFIFQLQQETDLREETLAPSQQSFYENEVDVGYGRVQIACYFLVRFEPYGAFKQHQMFRIRITQGSTQEIVQHNNVMVWQNKLIVANRDHLRWIDLNSAAIERKSEDAQKTTDRKEIVTYVIRLEDFQKVKMHDECKILAFQELTNNIEVGVVCEVPYGGQLVFVKINSLDDNLEFESLTSNIKTEAQEDDKIVAWKSVVFYSQKFLEYRQVGIVLRESGNLDFYYRYKIVETVKKISGRREFVHIDLDLDNIHFKTWDEEEQQLTTYTCRTQWDQRVGFNTSMKVDTKSLNQLHKLKRSQKQHERRKNLDSKQATLDSYNLNEQTPRKDGEVNGNNSQKSRFSKSEIEAMIKRMKSGIAGCQSLISKNFKCFNSFINAGRKLLLAHNCFVSVFNFVKNEWTQHIKFSDQVRTIFINRLPLADKNEADTNYGVLVGRSQFHFLSFTKMGRIKLERKTLKAPGSIEKFTIDSIYDSAFYMIITVPKDAFQKRQTNVIIRRNKSIRVQICEESPMEALNIHLWALVDQTFSEITPKKNPLVKIPLSMCLEIKQKITGLYSQTLVMDTSNSPFAGWNLHLDVIRQRLLVKSSELSLKLSLDMCDVKLLSEEFVFIDTPTMLNPWTEMPWEKIQDKQQLLGKISLRNGKSVRISNRHIEIVSEDNVVETKFEDRNIRSFILIEEKYLYALIHSQTGYDAKEKRPAGEAKQPSILVWDFDTMTADQPSLDSNILGDSVGGANDQYDYDNTTQTLAYIKDYNQLVIIPLLHRNTLKFYGMGQKSDYLLWRNTKGLFIALDKQLKVTAWSTVTGKIVTSKSIKAWPNAHDFELILKDVNYDNTLSDRKNVSQVQFESDLLFVSEKLSQTKPSKSQFDTPQQPETIDLQNYEVYSANSRDITYSGSLFSYEDHSISLVVCNNLNATKEMSSQKNDVQLDFSIFGQKQDRQINVRNYQRAEIEQKTYVFKVLQMNEKQSNSIFDTKAAQKSCIKIEFSDEKDPKVFFWQEVYKFKMHIPISKNSRPVLQLSRNLTRLLKRNQTDSDAVIYEHEGIEDGFVKWIPKFKLSRYPVILQGESFANFLFSPNFDKFIDMSYQDNQFLIMDTQTQKCINKIPPGMLSLSFRGREQSKAAIRALASRMMFHSDTEIRVINKEGIDCILDISVPNDLKIKSFVRIDNFELDDFSHPHALLQKRHLQPHEVFQRLISTNMLFKQTLCHLQQKLERQEMSSEEIKKKLNVHLYATIFNVDFTQKESFAVELSFTMLDWIILERIVQDRSYDFTSVSESQQIQLCFNIFPRIKTVFHILAVNAHVCDFKVIQGIFTSASTASEGREKVTLPILPDENGDTPIDLCLSEDEQKNIKLAALLFKNTKNYPFLHSSVFLQKAVVKAIRYNVPLMGEYLDCRFQESSHLSSESMSNNALINPNSINGYSFVLTQQQVWCDKQALAKSLFDPSGYPRALRLCYFDIPNISDESILSDDFFEALGETENLSLFSHLSIQILINSAWENQKKFFLCYFFLPYLLLLACYVGWTDTTQVDFELQTLYSTKETQEAAGLVFKIGVIAMGSFIILQEVWQMIKQPKQYFQDFWNYVDLMPCICSLVPVIQDFTVSGEKIAGSPQWVRVFQALASIFLWLKVLYFLRSFKQTGYLIKLIIEVIQDISVFLLILFVAQLAFADAFFTFSNMQTDTKFVPTFFDAIIMSYNFTLGNIYMDAMESKAAILTMVLSTLFTSVVMLNLLIAIVSATFSRVMDRYEEFAMLERTMLVSSLRESNFVMKRPKKEDSSKYTFICITREQEESQAGDADLRLVMSEVKELKSEIKKISAAQAK